MEDLNNTSKPATIGDRLQELIDNKRLKKEIFITIYDNTVEVGNDYRVYLSDLKNGSIKLEDVPYTDLILDTEYHSNKYNTKIIVLGFDGLNKL